MPDAPQAYVSRNLFGLSLTIEKGHSAITLLRRLPRDLWIGPLAGTGDREFILALDARTLSFCRTLYATPHVRFSPDALAALQALSGRTQGAASSRVARDSAAEKAPHRPAQGHARVVVAPEVSANLRGLGATLDRISSGATGPERPGEMTAPLSDKGKPA